MNADSPQAPSRLPERPEPPDPLTTIGGDTVETADDWRERRAEIERLFRHYVYGYAPEPPEIETTATEPTAVLDGAGRLVEVTIGFPDRTDEASFTMALFLPADAGTPADPVPVVLALNAPGNHAVVDDDAVTVTDSAERFTGGERDGPVDRGVRTDFWCVERILARGYGFATVHCDDIDPDRDDFTDGVHAAFDDADLPGPPGTEWGTLAAWAWGLQRCVEVLREHESVAADEIAVTGHSRRGKAALWAGATDERIGLVAPLQSGTGGVALSRDNGQETVARINEKFPHWFNDVFPAFGEREARLPVDQHLLVAMVAPRPLIDIAGARDYWSNPGRALDSLRAAAPVWDLLGADGMASERPLYEGDEITPETAGDLVHVRRETEHRIERTYWEAILDFADLHFET